MKQIRKEPEAAQTAPGNIEIKSAFGPLASDEEEEDSPLPSCVKTVLRPPALLFGKPGVGVCWLATNIVHHAGWQRGFTRDCLLVPCWPSSGVVLQQ